jgi:methyltransferase (TIGR00027 family)
MPSIVVTASWAAAQRVKESQRPDRLFSDPLARALAAEEGMTALQLSEKYSPRHEETSNYIAIRVRFLDDLALRSTSQGIRQVVLLAAGMDARAYRLAWPPGTTLYELDHPELLEAKNEVLLREGAETKCRRVTLGVSLEHDWAPLLTSAGFLPEQPSLWLVEGLFYYLWEQGVEHVLTETSRLAARGSVLGTDLVSQSFLSSPWMANALKFMEERGMGWHFGTDDPAGLFGRHGWQVEVRSPGEEGTKCDPRRFPPTPATGQPKQNFFVIAQRE